MTDLLQPPASTGPPPMDPRFARRWIEARREEGRKRLHLILGVGAAVVCGGLALGSLYTPLFNVSHLRVTVDGPLPAGAVGHLSGVGTSTLMIDVHPSAIAARLDADPWLGQARVARHWPGTVTIAVVVRTPIAVVPTGGSGWVEVDPTGRVLATVASPPPGMPVLQRIPTVPAPGGWLAGAPGPNVAPGAPASGLADLHADADRADVPAGPAAALALLQSLPASLRPDVDSVQAGRSGPLSLVMSPPRIASGTVTVLLGDGSQLQSKITALLTILGQGDLSGMVGLDLSVPSRPAAITSSATLNALLAPGGLSALAAASAGSSSGPATGGGTLTSPSTSPTTGPANAPANSPANGPAPAATGAGAPSAATVAPGQGTNGSPSTMPPQAG